MKHKWFMLFAFAWVIMLVIFVRMLWHNRAMGEFLIAWWLWIGIQSYCSYRKRWKELEEEAKHEALIDAAKQAAREPRILRGLFGHVTTCPWPRGGECNCKIETEAEAAFVRYEDETGTASTGPITAATTCVRPRTMRIAQPQRVGLALGVSPESIDWQTQAIAQRVQKAHDEIMLHELIKVASVSPSASTLEERELRALLQERYESVQLNPLPAVCVEPGGEPKTGLLTVIEKASSHKIAKRFSYRKKSRKR